MTKDDIIVYSTQTCGYCHALKAWLDDHKIEYTAKSVDTDLEAQKELLDKLNGNFQGVPVTFIKDTMILGFDRAGITSALKLQGIEIAN